VHDSLDELRYVLKAPHQTSCRPEQQAIMHIHPQLFQDIVTNASIVAHLPFIFQTNQDPDPKG